MGLVLGRRRGPRPARTGLTAPPAHEPFDRLILALATLVYGRPEDPPRPARRLAFRAGMLGATTLLLSVALRHHALPAPWHRIGAALWLAAATVLMRGEKARGDRRIAAAAALGLSAALGFILWLAVRQD